ncbi:MAG: PAS domain-containing protein [Armatimonadetes bacterium]|nr:PAS domain-containing protein [Anaerolineae bacterium]
MLSWVALVLASADFMRSSTYFPFLTVVVLSAWFGGFKPGVVAVVISVLLIALYFLKPMFSLAYIPEETLALILFTFFGLMLSWLLGRTKTYAHQLDLTKNQLEAILDTMSDAVTVQDANFQPIYANHAAATLLNFSSTEAMVLTPVAQNQARFERYDNDGKIISLDRLPSRAALNSGISQEVSYRLRRVGNPDERWITQKSSPVKDRLGRSRMVVNILRDDTARMTYEKGIEYERERLKTILDHVPSIIWEAKGSPDGNQIPTFVSNYIETMYGQTVEEAMTNRTMWIDSLHPEDREQAIADATQVYNMGGGTIQYRVIAKNGRVVHSETRSKVEFNEKGEVTLIRGVTSDITRRKQDEAALTHYALELKRSNEELQQFAYVASHDLQEPLRMVTSYLQLLEQRYATQLDDDAREFIGYAVDGAVRMKALISDLLALSRVNMGERSLTWVNCETVVQMVMHDMQMTIEDTGATLTSEHLPTIKADEQHIKQLFQNLVGNALKFRDPARPPNIQISAVQESRAWRFTVRDNGIGIEPQYLKRIFDIFQRLQARATYPGTGIGLAICRKVVQYYGGEIWAESEPGIGTTFIFTLPT